MPLGAAIVLVLLMMIPLAAVVGHYWIRHKKLEMERVRELNNLGRFGLEGTSEADLRREVATLRQDQQQLQGQVAELQKVLQANALLPPATPESPAPPTEEAARRIAELAKRLSGGPPA